MYQLYNLSFTGAGSFYWGVFDFEFSKERFSLEPLLYKVGLEGRLFNSKVFWGWQLYACVQAVFILFTGMVFPMMSAVESGKMIDFWAGGHVVYFMCVLVVNMVMLRNTNNWQGWNEAVILMQTSSYFLFVYLDSIWLTKGVIAYFMEEFTSSWTAWLGCCLIASLIFIEKASIDAIKFYREW